MSFEKYCDEVEDGLKMTAKKLAAIKNDIQDGVLKTIPDVKFIVKVSKLKGEFRHYTAKRIDELMEYCEDHETITMDMQKIIHDFQMELEGYETELMQVFESLTQIEQANYDKAIEIAIKKSA